MDPSSRVLEETGRRESLALRLRAAQGHVSRELVSDLARASCGRELLLEHAARLREKNDEGRALVVAGALRLLEDLGGGSRGGAEAAPLPRGLARAVESGKLVEPRRRVAFLALRERGDVFARTRSRAFLEGLERLQSHDTSKGVATLVSEETIERSVPKVGRNDPCPCGSGKKFKKCCEKAAPSGPPPLGALLERVRWTEELYALSPEKQLEVAGETVFREHLELLAQPDRPRRAPRDDPYLELAVLARVLQSRTSPSWARDGALALLARGHEALDRGALAAWLVETRGETASSEETRALVDRTSTEVERGPLTVEGAVAFSLALLDAGAHARALEAASRRPEGARDARLAFVRALAAQGAGDAARARAELELLDRELAFPDADVLRAAVSEARAGLDDPIEDEPATSEDEIDEDEEPSAPARPVPELATDLARRAESAAVASSPRESEVPAPVAPPRSAPLLDAALPAEIVRLSRARAGEESALEAELVIARKEHEEARSALRALERELEQASDRAQRAKRALARRQQELASRKKDGPRRELAAVAATLESSEAFLLERSREHWPRAEEVTIPIVAALLPDLLLLVAPLRADAYFQEDLGPDLSRLAHALVATAANVARQSEQPEDSVRPASALGFLSVLGDAPLASYRERGELWALAIDDAWSRMKIAGSTRLSPCLAVLPQEAAQSLVDIAVEVDLAPRAAAPHERREGEPLTVEQAARGLGRSAFELARSLGARSLWDSAGLVLPGVVETIRALEGERSQDAPAPAGAEHEASLDRELEKDQVPSRRALRTVLRRLIRLGKIGASHTRVDNAIRGTPPHLRGTVKEAVDALLALGVFRPKPTHNGLHISLEPHRLPEVDAFIRSGETPWPRVATILLAH